MAVGHALTRPVIPFTQGACSVSFFFFRVFSSLSISHRYLSLSLPLTLALHNGWHRNIRELETKHSAALSSITAEESSTNSDQIDELTRQTNDASSAVSAALKEMDAANREFSKENGSTAETRIRSNMHATLLKKFQALLAEYQYLTAKAKARYCMKCCSFCAIERG